MQTDPVNEAKRQAEICNACRYCEGFCSVFPAMHGKRRFSDAEMIELANLCHNCRGCYYACQYTAPHEFDLNLPKALAEVRHDSWESFAWPGGIARAFQRSGLSITLVCILGFAILFWTIQALGVNEGKDGFYRALSHGAMVSIFSPAFVLALVSIGVSMYRYWQATAGGAQRFGAIRTALYSAGTMKNLSGGHGKGCNFEGTDRFTLARRYAHQAVMYGFLLCLASTASGTVLHYFLDKPAPYAIWSFPKMLGVPGGLLMVIGGSWMMALKLKADRTLSDARAWGGEVGFILLLILVAGSGLILWVSGRSAAMPVLLALHLGSVLSFFLLMPFSKMAHGFYRLAALIRDANRR